MKNLILFINIFLICGLSYSQDEEIKTIASVETAFGSIWNNEVKSDQEEYAVLIVQPTIKMYIALKTVDATKMKSALKEIVSMEDYKTIRLDYVTISSDKEVIKFVSTYDGLEHFEAKRSDLKLLEDQI